MRHAARAAPPNTHVEWVIVIIGSPDLPLDHNRDQSWRPLKDLLRAILASEPDPYEFGNEQLGPANVWEWGNQRRGLCTFKLKRAAEKVLDRLGGNTWYGAQLAAVLWEQYAGNPMGLVRGKPDMPVRNPVSLDTLYRIKSTSHIHTIAQTFPSNPPSVRTNIRDSTTITNTYGLMPPQSGNHIPNAQYIEPIQVLHSQIMANWSSYNQVNAQQLRDQTQPILSLYPSDWSHQAIPSEIQLPSNQVFPPIVYPMDPYDVPSPQQAFPLTYYSQIVQPNTNPSPTYHENPNGTLVNICHGSFPVQPKGIHVRNLNHDANPKEVEEYFRSAGEIRDCQVRSSRKSKQCTAVVTFRSEQEAQLAVQKFNGTKFMGRQIEVKLDQENGFPEYSESKSDVRTLSPEEPTSPSRGPIIANGDSVPESSHSSRKEVNLKKDGINIRRLDERAH